MTTMTPGPTLDFDSLLASLPNEIFTFIIIEKLDPVSIVSLLAHVGFELFTRYIPSKSLFSKIKCLRVNKCEHLIWDYENFESSLLIFFALCRLNVVAPQTIKRDKPKSWEIQLSPLFADIVLVHPSWNIFCCDSPDNSDGNSNNNNNFFKTLHDFLYAKREWFKYEIVIWDIFVNEEQYTYPRMKWKASYIGLFDAITPSRGCIIKKSLTADEIKIIIDELLDSGKYQLIVFHHVPFKILQPIIKLNFNFDHPSTVIQQIFGDKIQHQQPNPDWVISTLSCAEQLYLYNNNRIGSKIEEETVCALKFVKTKIGESYLKIERSLTDLRSFQHQFVGDGYISLSFKYCKGLRLVMKKYIKQPFDIIISNNYYAKSSCRCYSRT